MYDLEDNPLANGSISVDSEQQKTFSVKIDCRTNYVLRLKDSSTLTVEGRRDGDSEWTNLDSSQIDLSDWNGTRRTFEIRITGEAVTARTLRTIILKVVENE